MNWEQAYREECRKLEDVRIELQEREEEICEMQLLLDQANEKLKVHFSNVIGVFDWKKFEEKFFNECVNSGGYVKEDSFEMCPSQLFEWIKKNINQK